MGGHWRHGWLDCRYAERGGKSAVEFSWEGEDEGDQRRHGGQNPCQGFFEFEHNWQPAAAANLLY